MIIKGNRIVKGDVQAPAEEIICRGSLTAATGTTVGAVLDLTNDTGMDLIVTDVLVDIKTVSTGAGTIDMGIDDAGDTSNDLLLDGADMNAATGILDNRIDKGTKGGMAVWPDGYHLVASASASLAGLVATYAIRAIPRG